MTGDDYIRDMNLLSFWFVREQQFAQSAERAGELREDEAARLRKEQAAQLQKDQEELAVRRIASILNEEPKQVSKDLNPYLSVILSALRTPSPWSTFLPPDFGNFLDQWLMGRLKSVEFLPDLLTANLRALDCKTTLAIGVQCVDSKGKVDFISVIDKGTPLPISPPWTLKLFPQRNSQEEARIPLGIQQNGDWRSIDIVVGWRFRDAVPHVPFGNPIYLSLQPTHIPPQEMFLRLKCNDKHQLVSYRFDHSFFECGAGPTSEKLTSLIEQCVRFVGSDVQGNEQRRNVAIRAIEVAHSVLNKKAEISKLQYQLLDVLKKAGDQAKGFFAYEAVAKLASPDEAGEHLKDKADDLWEKLLAAVDQGDAKSLDTAVRDLSQIAAKLIVTSVENDPQTVEGQLAALLLLRDPIFRKMGVEEYLQLVNQAPFVILPTEDIMSAINRILQIPDAFRSMDAGYRKQVEGLLKRLEHKDSMEPEELHERYLSLARIVSHLSHVVREAFYMGPLEPAEAVTDSAVLDLKTEVVDMNAVPAGGTSDKVALARVSRDAGAAPEMLSSIIRRAVNYYRDYLHGNSSDFTDASVYAALLPPVTLWNAVRRFVDNRLSQGGKVRNQLKSIEQHAEIADQELRETEQAGVVNLEQVSGPLPMEEEAPRAKETDMTSEPIRTDGPASLLLRVGDKKAYQEPNIGR